MMIKMNINKLEKMLKNNGAPKEAILFAEQNLGKAQYTAFAELFSSEEKAKESAKIINSYSKIEGNTYAKAVFNLIQNAGENQPQFTLNNESKIYRPLSFKENLIARIEHPELFDQYLNSCTGVASKKKSPLIKINPICKELITIDKDFNDSFINIDYKSFEGEELNTEKTSKMDKWLIAMGGNNSENKEIYKDYQEALFERRPNLSKEDAMNFYTVKKPSKDQLRALYVYVDSFSSIAYCNLSLSIIALLLRVD